jgi:hypothetical protein
MKYEEIRYLSEEQFRRLTGIKRLTFNRMIDILQKEFVKKKARGGSPDKVSISEDTGYIGIKKIHSNSILPKKSSKKKPLNKENKAFNRCVSSIRVFNENVVGSIKRFKIISDKYRNRRKRFGLRFNLIAGIYNFEINI